MATRGAVFIATSVDGYIARPDGAIDWLHDPAYALPGEDFGYADFVAGVDALVMGRRSFDAVRGFDPWPYEGRRVIVPSRSLEPDVDDRIEVSREAPDALMRRLADEGLARVYVDGGRLIASYLDAGLIDDMTITRIPILLGGGLPLFAPRHADVRLEHVRTNSYANGFVRTTYRVRGGV